ncbi:hypothetical protein AMJ57_03535 [Parcubacteria bacterium SG8_24]|nr:MAG: hypothetical protein AMJ57_03535 [Parcubacteria bacterium SG8_24]
MEMTYVLVAVAAAAVCVICILSVRKGRIRRRERQRELDISFQETHDRILNLSMRLRQMSPPSGLSDEERQGWCAENRKAFRALIGCLVMQDAARRSWRTGLETRGAIDRHLRAILNSLECFLQERRERLRHSLKERRATAGWLLDLAGHLRHHLAGSIEARCGEGFCFEEEAARIAKLRNALKADESVLMSDPLRAIELLCLQFGIMQEVMRRLDDAAGMTGDGDRTP